MRVSLPRDTAAVSLSDPQSVDHVTTEFRCNGGLEDSAFAFAKKDATWTVPVSIDTDQSSSQLYNTGVCTMMYGTIVQDVSVRTLPLDGGTMDSCCRGVIVDNALPFAEKNATSIVPVAIVTDSQRHATRARDIVGGKSDVTCWTRVTKKGKYSLSNCGISRGAHGGVLRCFPISSCRT